MFCPDCGTEERQANQFCRSCGADLRRVRVALETPDSITASAMSARDEIGRAVAERIREVESARELKKVAEDVLPQIEKFLESPAEKRLRRIRVGTLIACIGVGATISLSIASKIIGDEQLMFIAAMGFVTFFVGLGFILNGYFLTVPQSKLSGLSSNADSQRVLDSLQGQTNELRLSEPPASQFASVTESTTRHLKEKQPR